MTDGVLYAAAFLIGLGGGVHCVGMCGGISGALTLGLPQQDWRQRLPFLLAYNCGRMSSYVIAGALAGGIGAWAAHLLAVQRAQLTLQIIAGLFMVLLGLYLMGWSRVLGWLERSGASFWRRIEPLGRRLFPVRSPLRAWGIGLVWGWLPCGLVYSVLVWAVSAGGSGAGALLLLSFGLGTLPTLLALGAAASTLQRFLRRQVVRNVTGSLVALFGIYEMYLALRMIGI